MHDGSPESPCKRIELQILSESVILSLAGGVLGVLLRIRKQAAVLILIRTWASLPPASDTGHSENLMLGL